MSESKEASEKSAASASAAGVYLVRGHCEDDYCGCGGGHLLAVGGTEEEAKRLADQASGVGTFFAVVVTGPFVIGSIISEEQR